MKSQPKRKRTQAHLSRVRRHNTEDLYVGLRSNDTRSSDERMAALFSGSPPYVWRGRANPLAAALLDSILEAGRK